uniref:Uncharacterized protein n=1 Tax=Arcella intermedia TaxID=1963864 RepID=A0A6B2LUR3_9EUKA
MAQLFAEPELAGLPFLIYANKQDLPGALHPNQLISALGPTLTHRLSPLCIQASSSKTGQGPQEGFNWLAKILT